MENSATIKNNKLYLWLIGIVSVIIPIVVAVLFYMPKKNGISEFDSSFLPHLNAVLNSATTICLIAGFIFIKRNLQQYHITAMVTAFALSSLFLISYVIYHYTQTMEIKYGDLNHNGVLEAFEKDQVGGIRYFYYFILLTHILLSIFIVPLVLLAIYFGVTKQFKRHTKIVKWTFPIWLYVAITGVLVYLMISPFYIS